jgi:light-regulated signal transduction histidine kinase (bacteriophytochrome)
MNRLAGHRAKLKCARWRNANAPDGIFASDHLSGVYDLAKDFAIEASGILAISASRSPSDYIIWFRAEEIEAVRWAGDPSKPAEIGPHGDRLTPRKSFDE